MKGNMYYLNLHNCTMSVVFFSECSETFALIINNIIEYEISILVNPKLSQLIENKERKQTIAGSFNLTQCHMYMMLWEWNINYS